MITAGVTWLSYMGVPGEYPGGDALARDVDDAMWDAALAVLREYEARDVVLRVMRDDRYRFWELVDGVPVGGLPPGIEVVYRQGGRIVNGVVRAPYESAHPRVYAAVDWRGDRWSWHPSLRLDEVVQAWLPVPLDVSALIGLVAAEVGQVVPRPAGRRPVRRVVDWGVYGECGRRGCWAVAGAPCVDVRSVFTVRRSSARPHPGRARRAAAGVGS